MRYPLMVYALDDGETVECYYCVRQRDHTLYKKGEAYLAGPDHPPYNAEANFICNLHLEPDAIRVEDEWRI